MFESESREMYLKSILELQQDEEPVALSLVAERMGVSTVSANEMGKRLAESGLVTHIPYKGLRLTEAGRLRALSVVRRQRLWGRFLADHLHIPWEQVYDFACRLEHATDDVVTEALADFLGNPEKGPYGNPIPDAQGNVAGSSAVSLKSMKIGERGQVDHIDRLETTLVNYLASRGILPEVELQVVDEAPYQGPLTILINGQEQAIGREIAARVMVERKQRQAS
jgi:DtxR family Mn-dependent transcriptional regulator